MVRRGSVLWDTSVVTGVEARKAIFVAVTVAIIMCTATMSQNQMLPILVMTGFVGEQSLSAGDAL
eukprot:3404332-Amphidinium_carterae.1